MKKTAITLVIFFALFVGFLFGQACKESYIRKTLIIANVGEYWNCPECGAINSTNNTYTHCYSCGYDGDKDVYGRVDIDFGHHLLDDGHYSDHDIEYYRYNVS